MDEYYDDIIKIDINTFNNIRNKIVYDNNDR